MCMLIAVKVIDMNMNINVCGRVCVEGGGLLMYGWMLLVSE